jgi:hypothetical protein
VKVKSFVGLPLDDGETHGIVLDLVAKAFPLVHVGANTCLSVSRSKITKLVNIKAIECWPLTDGGRNGTLLNLLYKNLPFIHGEYQQICQYLI